MRISDWSSDVCSSDLRSVMAFLYGHGQRYSRYSRTAGKGFVFYSAFIGAPSVSLTNGFHNVYIDSFFPETIVVPDGPPFPNDIQEIGRETCRVRVCQYLYISLVPV